MGCGNGELSHALAAGGWDVLGIDPAAPRGDIFRPLKLEELEPEPFDAVVAVRSLHHVTDLDVALDRIVAMLPLGGPLVVEEFAWDLFDEPTSAWYCERADAESLETCRREWEDEHVGLHGYAAMRPAFDSHFDERSFGWRPYLYRLLDGKASEEEETSLIEAGSIRATGFRYVGSPR